MTSPMRVSLVALSAAAVIAGFAAGAGAAEKVSWDWAIYGPPREITRGLEVFVRAAEEKSGGNFKITMHYGEAISPVKEVLDGIKVGVLDGGIWVASYGPGKAPLHTVLDLPFLPIPNVQVQEEAIKAVLATEPLKAESARWNAIDLIGCTLPLYEFMGTGKPPQTLDDWKGMRVRALGGAGDAMRMLGSVPTTVPAPEIYTGLERGTFQAAGLPTYAHGVYRLYEVSKWYTQGFALGSILNTFGVNKSSFDALPAEYRQILLDAKPEAYRVWREEYGKSEQTWLDTFKKHGLTAVPVDPDTRNVLKEKAGKPVWEKWVAEMEGKGLPGRQTLDIVLKAAEEAQGS